MNDDQVLGAASSLWRYPVKSMLGESTNMLKIEARGVVGDRLFAVTDEQGKLGSGKNTRRFRRIDGLFALSAQLKADGIRVVFPGGRSWSGSAAQMDDLNRALSAQLGQAVRITQENMVSHFDDGALHIVLASSLSKLRKLLPSQQVDERRFRANIVINDENADYDEAELVGKTINIRGVELEITHQAERCRMVALAQTELRHAPAILKQVSQDFDLHFGLYAKVKKAGSIYIGDPVLIRQ